MNDPDRRRSFDAFDDDAIFADIVAHMNDDVSEAEPVARPAPDHAATEPAATDNKATDKPTDETTTNTTATNTTATNEKAADETAEKAAGRSLGDERRADPRRWPVNPPPWLALPADSPNAETPEADLPEADRPAASAPLVWRAHEVAEPEEHFEPPPVSPLPAGDLQFWAILAGMGGGPLLLLYLVFFNRDASSMWVLIAIAMSVGGFAMLVSRMPGHHEDDDDGSRL